MRRWDWVPDEIWNEAARHYDERGLASLLVAIGTINVWNRLNVATKQVAFGRIPEAPGLPDSHATQGIANGHNRSQVGYAG